MKYKPSSSRELVGPASLLAVGILYGLSAVIAKFLSRTLDPYQVIEYRFGVAFIASLLVLLLTKQRLMFRNLNKKVLAAFAITFPASALLFTLSIFHTSVALAVFTFYSANLVAQFVLGRVFFGERINQNKLLAFAATIMALVAFTNPFNNFSITLGLWLGLSAGALQGVASSFQKLLSKSSSKLSLLVMQSLCGLVMANIILLIAGRSVAPFQDGFGWLVLVVFGLSMLAIMYLFLVGYKRTNLNVGSVLVSSELLFGPLFAYLLLSEHVSANVFVGGILTLVAAVLANWPLRREHVNT